MSVFPFFFALVRIMIEVRISVADKPELLDPQSLTPRPRERISTCLFTRSTPNGIAHEQTAGMTPAARRGRPTLPSLFAFPRATMPVEYLWGPSPMPGFSGLQKGPASLLAHLTTRSCVGPETENGAASYAQATLVFLASPPPPTTSFAVEVDDVCVAFSLSDTSPAMLPRGRNLR
jgi:hypothetical protein